jgi:hypothetical protein
MSSGPKNGALLRTEIPPHLLEDNPANPNVMSDREFDLLVDNISKAGFTENIVASPSSLDDLLYFKEIFGQTKKKDFDSLWSQIEADGKRLRIVSGHHRNRAAVYLGYEKVPVTILFGDEFDPDQGDIQLVRHNVIHGHLSPAKFMSLYSKYAEKYGEDLMADVFGFADEDAMRTLIAETEKTLPDEMKKKFKEAAAEIKTVDDLAKLLNRLFSTYGDTLPYGFMFFDYGGKDSVWLRVSKKTLNALHVIGDRCTHEERTIDSVVGEVLQLIATGGAEELLSSAVSGTKKTTIPPGFKGMPTEDMLDTAGVL